MLLWDVSKKATSKSLVIFPVRYMLMLLKNMSKIVTSGVSGDISNEVFSNFQLWMCLKI